MSFAVKGKIDIAIDLGTTNIVGRAFKNDEKPNLAEGKSTQIGLKNPGLAHGDDLLSRLEFSLRGEAERRQSKNELITAIETIAIELIRDIGAPVAYIDRMVVAGNTAMLHLLLGLDAKGLSVAPFISKINGFYEIDLMQAGFLNLPLHTEREVAGRLIIPPIIGSHIGADITAGLVYLDSRYGFLGSKQPSLFLDIGTNAEMVLVDGSRLLACSAAAGPCFSGSGLSKELTGSEVVSATAAMLSNGSLDTTGKLLSENSDFSQADIRKVQLAKAAIIAGIKTLVHGAGKDIEDFTDIYIAGAFGTALDIDSAISIGLLPKLADPSRYKAVGNTSLLGASLFLADELAWEKAKYIENQTKLIELAHSKEFQKRFIDEMDF